MGSDLEIFFSPNQKMRIVGGTVNYASEQFSLPLPVDSLHFPTGGFLIAKGNFKIEQHDDKPVFECDNSITFITGDKPKSHVYFGRNVCIDVVQTFEVTTASNYLTRKDNKEFLQHICLT